MKTFIISLKIFLFFTHLNRNPISSFCYRNCPDSLSFKSNGSLIVKNNKIIGSELIGQHFDSTIYFTSRPSAVSNNPLPSGGSNYGLTNVKLKHSVDSLKKQFYHDKSIGCPYGNSFRNGFLPLPAALIRIFRKRRLYCRSGA